MPSVLNAVTQAMVRVAEETDSLPQYNPDDVTPGVIGFGFTALFAIVVILLGLDMYRRIRRVRFREEIRQDIESELALKNEGAQKSGDEDDPEASQGG